MEKRKLMQFKRTDFMQKDRTNGGGGTMMAKMNEKIENG